MSAPGRGGQLAVDQGQAAVGARADADIVVAAPVDEVVARAGRLAPGVVGDLVGVEAGRLQHRLGGFEQGGGQVLVGHDQRAPADGAVEGGAGLDG